MGWTETYTSMYDKNGKVDVKGFLDNDFTWTDKSQNLKHTVIKSSMVGSTYYAAVKEEKEGQESRVFGLVCLTSTKQSNRFNIGYKAISEDMGPAELDCPVGILNLLTPTEYEYANEWRENCRKYHKEKKTSVAYLKNTKVGDRVIFYGYGQDKVLVHMPPYAQFRTDFWKIEGKEQYVRKSEVTPRNTIAYTFENLEKRFAATLHMLGSKELYHGMPSVIRNNNEKELANYFTNLLKSAGFDKNGNHILHTVPAECRFVMKVALDGSIHFEYTDTKKEYFCRYKGEAYHPEIITKEDFSSDLAISAINDLEQRFREYITTYSREDVIEAENTFLKVLTTFGNSDVGEAEKVGDAI